MSSEKDFTEGHLNFEKPGCLLVDKYVTIEQILLRNLRSFVQESATHLQNSKLKLFLKTLLYCSARVTDTTLHLAFLFTSQL